MLPNLDTERRLQVLERFMREIRGDRGAQEPGVWTPVFFGTGTAGTFTYTNQTGFYTRIGNRVLINGLISISAIAVAPTLDMRITGLPLTSGAEANNFNTITFSFSNLDLDAGFTSVIGQINVGVTYMVIMECGDNVARAIIQGATFDNNVAVSIVFSGSYKL